MVHKFSPLDGDMVGPRPFAGHGSDCHGYDYWCGRFVRLFGQPYPPVRQARYDNSDCANSDKIMSMCSEYPCTYSLTSQFLPRDEFQSELVPDALRQARASALDLVWSF